MEPLDNIDCDFINQQLSRSYIVPTRLLLYNRDSIMGLLVTPMIVQADALLDSNQVEAGVSMANQALQNLSAQGGSRGGGRIVCIVSYMQQL
jgi:hypothetical protein